jgi:hypothetical protein
LGRKSSGSCLEIPEYFYGDPYAAPVYPQKLTLTSSTSGGRSVGIVRSRTQATELLIVTAWNYFQSHTNFQICSDEMVGMDE